MESLVSQAIHKHLGIEDPDYTLSKFIINLYDQASTTDQTVVKFKQLLADNGGDFPQDFIDDVLAILHPVKQELFSALAIPDMKIDYGAPKIKQEPGIKQEPEIKQQLDIKQEATKHVKREHTHIKREPPQEGHIYQGTVKNITAFGAFINVNNTTGLCHISNMSFDRSRIRLPHDVVKVNQDVFVKVLSIDKSLSRISLSMRGVDQVTGIDHGKEMEERSRKREREEPKPKRRLTSPERWEIRQLIASGVAKAEDYPELNGPEEGPRIEAKVEEDIDVELLFQEPKFLQGQTVNLEAQEPAKIVKNPEGSMRRAAIKGSSLAKEIREKRSQQQREKDKQDRQERAKNMNNFDPMNKQPDEIPILLEWKRSQAKVTFGKRTNLSIKQQREQLPVFSMRQELVSKIKENQFLVIVGETGSGKTTQIVQYLAEEGLNTNSEGQHKIIGCTQPRRVAATSVAKRVAEERGTPLGKDVGYTVRFDDNTSPGTNIKYMTDGMLQREAINDPTMSKYSVIMLDEAHERTIATDVLFALLKKAAESNPDLKIIVTSATLDSKKFSQFFHNCPVVKIPGRTFPVEILYTQEPEMDYLSAALDSVLQIHVSEPPGDILVFLTGQDEIDTSCEVLYERVKALGDSVAELIILPVYSSLPSEMQSKIFEPTPSGSRKVILATNIAETSITIDGIFYVIDPGFVKVNAYDPKLGMDSLLVSPISQAQANQRSGRAGRTGPGKCYRLYTEKAYNEEMLPNTIPEIQRTNLSNTILLLKAMGINDLLNFGFMDPPKVHTMLSALQELYTLGALDDDGYLTRLGKTMSDFPMEPKLSKTLIKLTELECSEEVLTIVSMLSVQNVFYRPKDKQTLADQRRARFSNSQGDHLTLLNVYRSWAMNGYNKRWCSDNFIQERSMRRAQDVKSQLVRIMNKNQHGLVSCGLDTDKVVRAFCSGFFKNSAKRHHQEGYQTLVENTTVYLHPSSTLQGKEPDYVIYHTLLLTTKEYMQCTTVISPQYLMEAAPTFFKKAEAGKGRKIVPLYDKFKTDETWRLSSHIANKKRLLDSQRE